MINEMIKIAQYSIKIDTVLDNARIHIGQPEPTCVIVGCPADTGIASRFYDMRLQAEPVCLVASAQMPGVCVVGVDSKINDIELSVGKKKYIDSVLGDFDLKVDLKAVGL